MKRLLLGCAAMICLYWGIAPLFISRLHTGCVVLTAVGIIMLAAVFQPTIFIAALTWLWHRAWGKVLYGAVALVVLLFLVVSGMMVSAAVRAPTTEKATVIVLGAGIRGDKPSRMLKARLDAAIAYLREHPQAVCVVSGGKNPDEIVTEASVMRRYLLEQGINDSRVFEEDRSASTYENIRFSRKIIQDNHLPEEVAIATQEFHQYRGQAFARKAGFTQVRAVTAHSEFTFLPGYWIRDFAGICHMALLGN